MIPFSNHHFQCGRSEVVIIYPETISSGPMMMISRCRRHRRLLAQVFRSGKPYLSRSGCAGKLPRCLTSQGGKVPWKHGEETTKNWDLELIQDRYGLSMATLLQWLTQLWFESPFRMGQLTISMAISNNYLELPEGNLNPIVDHRF